MVHDKRLRWSNVTFLAAFALTLWLFLKVVAPFWIPILLAASGAIVLSPINEWLVKKLGGRRHLASTLSLVGTALLLLAPTAYISYRLVQEAIPLFRRLATSLGPGGVSSILEGRVPDPLAHLLQKFPVTGIENQIASALDNVAGWLSTAAAAVPAAAAGVLSDGFLVLVVLYAFFVRGPALTEMIISTVPMNHRYSRRIMDTISTGIRSIFVASFLTALIQGVVGFIGFKIAKVPYAIPLAALMAFFSFIFSLVPVLGTGLVWVPAAIWLFVSGHRIAGIFLAVWGILVIGTVDNFVKPLFTQGPLALPPSMVFVTLFGGIVAFGPVGAILGPLIAALAALFVRMWREDFLPSIGFAPGTNGGPKGGPSGGEAGEKPVGEVT